jgi:hypothetical protein
MSSSPGSLDSGGATRSTVMGRWRVPSGGGWRQEGTPSSSAEAASVLSLATRRGLEPSRREIAESRSL